MGHSTWWNIFKAFHVFLYCFSLIVTVSNLILSDLIIAAHILLYKVYKGTKSKAPQNLKSLKHCPALSVPLVSVVIPQTDTVV